MDEVNFPGWRPEKSLQVVEGDGRTSVLVKGQLYMSWRSGDEGCLRLAMAQLYECGLGREEDLAEAFGRHVNSVQKYLKDFADEGIRGLMSERRGPKGRWKLTAQLRGKILLIVLREGIWPLEAIQQRLMEAWHEAASVPSIQQVLEENGLGKPITRSVGDEVVQGELFALQPEPQLVLPLASHDAQPAEKVGTGSVREKESGTGNGNAAGGGAGVADLGSGWRRDDCSPAQRVYLDHLEQGAYNAHAGGLLFAPLLARYNFVPTLSRVITMATHEGYSLDELGLTLFYLDVFGFRSMEDFKRAYPGEFGLLVGRTQSPSLFTLRRFLHKVRKLGQGQALIDEFAPAYLKSGLAAWGVMYIDGHFLPYYGLYPISNGAAEEIGAERSVPLICRRWGEENAIKELLHKHLINHTPGYVLEELEEQPLVDNPEVKELKKQRAGLVSELNRLKIELADHLIERPGKKRRTPRRSRKEVLDDITVVEGKILLADEQLDKLPLEIRFDLAHAGEKLLKLNHEKKRILDCMKVFVCNLKAEMCRLLPKHYDWQKEVVPALAMIVERTGHVKLEGGRLEVTLRGFTDREIDDAARHLCEDLNRMQPATLDKFHLPIRYRVP